MRKPALFGVLVLLLGATGCTAAVGGGVLLAAVGTFALTSQCYDYLDVTVYDANGRKTCDAIVTAKSSAGSELELTSCYYTPLSNGNWTLRARLPGFPDVSSQVQVDNRKECIHHVQRIELSITAHAATAPNVSAPLPSTPPTSAPVAPDSEASGGAPPTNAFPDQGDAAH
jgi:hypothetical protein